MRRFDIVAVMELRKHCGTTAVMLTNLVMLIVAIGAVVDRSLQMVRLAHCKKDS